MRSSSTAVAPAAVSLLLLEKGQGIGVPGLLRPEVRCLPAEADRFVETVLGEDDAQVVRRLGHLGIGLESRS